ncbi:glycosyltransferase involved in cell wall biosynthesis [Chryseobacterium lathyri]|uniref:Glycosyltransferase involved in cell wall biosynthesis n=2 Tax=Chryseobacterium lathyri TaxID=395933 RepID=A0ABT9SL93_9FLAO|nr:glycosyltransferase involved in cell wall biosynthesis [Chryseobacterium lathyri]
MKIILIASYYFPIQDVSSLRIHSYCKAMAKKGMDIHVLMVYPALTECSDNGVFEGVKYSFLSDKKYYNGSLLNKLYFRLSGLNNIRKFIFTEKVDAVLSYHDNFLTNFFVKLFTILASIPFVIDKTEYPYGYFQMSKMRQFVERLNLSLFDGFIVISTTLKDFYSKISKNVFLLPMTIDPNRFDRVSRREDNDQYISLTFGVHNRDGLFDSIITFHKYLNKSPKKSFKLFLIGDYITLCKNFPECHAIKTYVQENELEDSVFFLGRKPIDEVPVILAGAQCLITTPTKYVSGGFPTKLGEYMLSGVPIVATKAGEILDYVTDNYDIFLCNVGDLDCMADKIIFIENDPKKAMVIGQNAINTAKFKFNADTYIEGMLEFLNSIKK